MDYEKEIVERINELSGSRSPYEVFCDWVKCTALAITNCSDIFRGKTWQKREDEYLKTIRPYGQDAHKISEMTDLLMYALENNMSDVLGKIYMDAGCGNKNTGQFFTPFHISKAISGCTLPDDVSPEKPAMIYEPSCGGGGMIIAVAKAIKEKDIDYQRAMKVIAQDLDWKAVYMTYVQLSLLGISAVVIQGDTLQEPLRRMKEYPPERIFRTPRKKGMLI